MAKIANPNKTIFNFISGGYGHGGGYGGYGGYGIFSFYFDALF